MGSRFDGKTVVITGGGRGIGAAMAEKFGHEQARVAIVELRADAAQERVRELREAGVNATAFNCDVTDEAQVNDCFDRIQHSCGGLDVLINNVGGGGSGPPELLLNLPLERWLGGINHNLTSVFMCSKVAAHMMIAAGKPGNIVSVSSINGKLGSPLLGVYSVAKAGVIRFTEVLAKELAPHGIRVNAICPGTVETPLTKRIATAFPQVFKEAFFLTQHDVGSGEPLLDAMRGQVPLHRLARPQDIADCAVFLASDEASYITGQAVNVSGGFIAF